MAKTNEELETALEESNKRLEEYIKKAEKDNAAWPELTKKLEALEKTVLEKIAAVETSSNLSSSEKSTQLQAHQTTLAEIKETLKAMENPASRQKESREGQQEVPKPKKYHLI